MSFDQPDPTILEILEFALTNNGNLVKGHKIYREIVNLKLVCRKWRNLLEGWIERNSYIIYTSQGELSLIYHPNVFFTYLQGCNTILKLGLPVYPKRIWSILESILGTYGRSYIIIRHSEYGYFVKGIDRIYPEYQLFRKN